MATHLLERGFPGMLLSAWRHRYLLEQMTMREIMGRYRGSLMGVLWSLVTPLLMLAIYTLVFGFIMPVRWTERVGMRSFEADSTLDYSLILFCGLLLHSFLSETLSRASGLIVANVNLVKRVVFPLDLLAWSATGSGLFHLAVGFGVLFVGYVLVHLGLNMMIVTLPFVLAPFVVMVMGFVWFLAASAVYVRDIGQAIPAVTTILMFTSPILFPKAAMPPLMQTLMKLNPLTVPVEQVRAAVIWGVRPDLTELAIYSVAALVVAWAGHAWFQRCRRGFADAL